jgi:site-specific recombinase XerD
MARALADALGSARRDGPQVQRDGRQVNARILGVAMKKATRAAGLAPTEGMHRLRHTFCSRLADRGAARRRSASWRGTSRSA